jgi:hypothetical protein
LLLLIKHPQHATISPRSEGGIVAEVPVWYVLNPFEHLSGAAAPRTENEETYARDALPVKGSTIPLGYEAVRLPAKIGHPTKEKPPTTRTMRLAAF